MKPSAESMQTLKQSSPKRASRTPSSVPRLTRQLAGIMAHLKDHPNDQLSKARVAKIQELLRE
jgi:ribosomal protein S15P/S13E